MVYLRRQLFAGICIAAISAMTFASPPIQETRDADKALNTEYNRLIKQLSTSEEESLRRAQRAWIRYRDLVCQFEAEYRKNEAGDWIADETMGRKDLDCIHRLTEERLSHLTRYLNKDFSLGEQKVCENGGEQTSPGRAGIRSLLDRGCIRRAQPDDFKAWAEKATAHGNELPSLSRLPGRERTAQAYVVEAPMRYPAGLTGAKAVTFLVAAGVAEPRGDRGHSIVYFMEDGSCQGLRCPH